MPTANPVTFKACMAAEIADSENPLVARGDVAYKGALYLSELVPAGQTAEIVFLVNGKELARKSCIATPQVGCNFVVEVRMKAFDNSKCETFKPKPLKPIEEGL